MTTNVSLKGFIGVVISAILIPSALFYSGVDALMIITLAIWLLIIVVITKDFNLNVFFICFMLSFFIFLISGDLSEQLFGIEYWLRFSENAIVHSRVCIIISLIFLFFGYAVNKTLVIRFARMSLLKTDYVYENYLKIIRRVSKMSFIITYVILIFTTLEKVMYSITYGYNEFYISYISHIPKIIYKLGDFAPISFCMFLATMPPKQDAKPLIRLFFVYAVIALFVGQRGAFVYNAAFLLGYLIFRNKFNNDGELWISKKQIVCIVCALPFLIVFLMLFQFWRSHDAIVYKSFGRTIVSFFVNIGSSSKVIKYGYEYREQLSKTFKFFSLGDTLTYLKFSDVFCLFTDYDRPAMHTAKYALECNNFGEIITYLVFPDRYCNGYGLGSSFIAELYADFGYVGIACGSFVYGRLFRSLCRIDKGSWFMNFVKLYMMLNIIKAPRGEFDKFIVCLVNVINLAFIVFVVALSYQICIYTYDKARRKV